MTISNWKVKTIALILLMVFTLACGCNLSGLTEKAAEIIAGNLIPEGLDVKKGEVRYEPDGIQCVVPDGYSGFFALIGITISPENNPVFTDPTYSVITLNSTEEKDFNYWVDNGRKNLEYSLQATNLMESEISVGNYKAWRVDYSYKATNPEDEAETVAKNGIKIIIDRTPGWITLIDADWSAEQDSVARDKFEQWLTSIQFFEPNRDAPKE